MQTVVNTQLVPIGGDDEDEDDGDDEQRDLGFDERPASASSVEDYG